ncbi:MAG: hypothetical protein EAZ91_20470 [Cytophagales bacterium]|nr:MAG: hypothetical protein EAZ91_20470 [Cytophagales bacterium]
MRALLALIVSCWLMETADAQVRQPIISLRASVLLVPFTPLLTVECRVVENLSLQGETNFSRIHGVNLKYYLIDPLQKTYVFVGSAFVESTTLRRDRQSTVLPYVGAGYAHVFHKNWVIDSRLGIGRTINADQNSIYPIIKTGIGKRF